MYDQMSGKGESASGAHRGIHQWLVPGLPQVVRVSEVRKRPEQPPVEDVVGSVGRTVRVLWHVVGAIPPRSLVDELATREAPTVGPG